MCQLIFGNPLYTIYVSLYSKKVSIKNTLRGYTDCVVSSMRKYIFKFSIQYLFKFSVKLLRNV